MPSSAEQFVASHRKAWQRLEELVKRAKKSSIKRLNNDELQELGSLYRRTAADLARAQTRHADSGAGRELVRSLNHLLLDAHTLVHSSAPARPVHAWQFVLYEFPAAFRRQWITITIAALLMALPALLAYAAVWVNPSSASLLVSEPAIKEVQRRADENITTGWGANTDFQGILSSPAVSSYIMTNNIRVSILAVAFGVTLGLGTAYVLIANGIMIGGLAAVAHNYHAGLLFWAVILPHGILELTAISIAGAAGLLLGRAILAPGALTRRDALRVAGRESMYLLCGVVVLLIIAGIIEGFITPLPFSAYSKLAFAMLTAIGLIAYLRARPKSSTP